MSIVLLIYTKTEDLIWCTGWMTSMFELLIYRLDLFRLWHNSLNGQCYLSIWQGCQFNLQKWSIRPSLRPCGILDGLWTYLLSWTRSRTWTTSIFSAEWIERKFSTNFSERRIERLKITERTCDHTGDMRLVCVVITNSINDSYDRTKYEPSVAIAIEIICINMPA